MASSMLFTAKNLAKIYSSAVPDERNVKGALASGENVIITNIWVYDTTNGSTREIGENEISDDDTRYVKMLYHSKGFSKKTDLEYQRNFVGDYNNATLINKIGATTKYTNLYYGPDYRAPIKTQLLIGVKCTASREKDGYYFVRSSDGKEGWIKISDIDIKFEDPTPLTSQTTPAADESYKFVIDDKITEILNSAGIYNRNQLEWYDKFNRFGVINPYTTITTTKEYLFFTKPDLHIYDSGPNNSLVLYDKLANIPIFVDANLRYGPVLRQLQQSAGDSTSKFINLLSNTVRSNLDLPGISADEYETSANIYGTALSYRTTSHKSDEAYDFSLEFEDTKYLEVYMFFKLFDEYERRKYFGEIKPNEKYIYRKILHDQISIYKFVVGEDGETLIYWAKLYGCYPKGIPRDSVSDLTSNGPLKFSVSWRAQFVDDMDPQILMDFNRLVLHKYNNTKDLDLYNQDIKGPDGRWAQIPYIAVPNIKANPLETKEMNHKYMLKWRI